MLGDEWGRILTLRYEPELDIFDIRTELRRRIPAEHAGAINSFLEICGPHRENIYTATGRP